MSGNDGAIYLSFDLGSGASCRGPAGAWATVTSPGGIGANGGVNVVATNAAQWFVTGVKLEIGSVATPFNRQSLAKSMADCQRYYVNYVLRLISTTKFVLRGRDNQWSCSNLSTRPNESYSDSDRYQIDCKW